MRLHAEQKLPPTNPVACQVEFRYYLLVQAGLIKETESKETIL